MEYQRGGRGRRVGEKEEEKKATNGQQRVREGRREQQKGQRVEDYNKYNDRGSGQGLEDVGSIGGQRAADYSKGWWQRRIERGSEGSME